MLQQRAIAFYTVLSALPPRDNRAFVRFLKVLKAPKYKHWLETSIYGKISSFFYQSSGSNRSKRTNNKFESRREVCMFSPRLHGFPLRAPVSFSTQNTCRLDRLAALTVNYPWMRTWAWMPAHLCVRSDWSATCPGCNPASHLRLASAYLFR